MASIAGSVDILGTESAARYADVFFEIVGTQIVEKPPLGAFESGLAGLIFELMGPFARAHGLGQVFPETLFDLRPAVDRSRRPDLAFVSAAKWPVDRRPPEEESWALIPDLAIEVVSRTNSAAHVLEKPQEYFKAGVQLVWIGVPGRQGDPCI